MHYAFLGMVIPDEMKEEVRKLSVNNMQDAANALQWHLYNGLNENLEKEISLLNLLPIDSFPQHYKHAFVKESTFKTIYCEDNTNIGFCNIKLIRKFFQVSKVYECLKRWCKLHSGDKMIFVYTISEIFMSAISKIKKEYPDLKICAIVADLPDMTCLKEKKGILLKYYEKKIAMKSYTELNNIDFFVLLTKHMAEYLKIDKPYCVMEGISTEPKNVAIENDINSSNIKKVMYTGTLHKRFGIMNLVNAFKEINNDKYRLIICGTGDSSDEIKEASLQDSRIEFKGQLSRDEILKLQKNATVLINPRQNIEEFTKYSFPSKNLEYLSSGIPLIAYKLDGIPNEYDKYIYYVKDNSIESLKNKIIQICEMECKERRFKAKEAQKFVLLEKNEIKQTGFILEEMLHVGLIKR